MPSHNETNRLGRRVVFLGASNLSRAFPLVVSLSQAVWNTPLSIFVAKGHGRSYGKVSCCFGKKNSGIFSCGIWRALEQEKSVPMTAFMTDIGNDLAYEVPVETILEWVETCLDRLLLMQAQVVLADLPLEALEQVSWARYGWFRTVFFPTCRLGRDEMLRRAHLLSQGLQQIAEKKNTPFFKGERQWYGWDPIHPRRRFLPTLWREQLALVAPEARQTDIRRCSRSTAWYLRRLQPASGSVFGFQRSVSQPSGKLSGGTTIALY